MAAQEVAQGVHVSPHRDSSEMVERVARAMCEARGENPGGSQIRFVDGAMHSATFLEIARNDVRAMLAALGGGELLPSDNELIEASVQAALDAGVAVNGEHGVAAARVAARHILHTVRNRCGAVRMTEEAQTAAARLGEHIKANNHPLSHASPSVIEDALEACGLKLVEAGAPAEIGGDACSVRLK